MSSFYNLFTGKRVAKIAILVTFALALVPNLINAQVRVEFEPRTSDQGSAQSRQIYNVRGDFLLIGNTNMTLENYSLGTGNGNNNMIYVDVDGDPSTLNSSSADLQFPDDYNANHECTNIIYAGLYWSGRSQTTTSAAASMTVVSGAKVIQGTITNQQTIGNSTQIPGTTNTNRTMTVARAGSGGDYYPRYSFRTNANNTNVTWYVDFLNTYPYIRYATGTGNNANWIYPTVYSVVEEGSSITVTFRPINLGTISNNIITVDQMTRTSGGGISAAVAALSTARINVGASTSVASKTYTKNVVQIKHANDGAYTQFTASTEDIYYPGTASGNMFVGYVDVTDFVRQRGVGEYTVSEIALFEGDGGGTGYYGNWGMVVVYENSVFPWRDIVVFDGYAYMAGSTTGANQFAINGIHSVQDGEINVKLGLMAGEGDLDINGEYFQVARQVNGIPQTAVSDYSYINRDGQIYTPGTNNFFRSEIQVSSDRFPEIENNTGVDIALFNLANSDKRFVTNNQTSMSFRYGSTQDTYIIYSLVAAIDAYIPEPEALNMVAMINGEQIDYDPEAGLGSILLYPRDTITYTLEIRNKGDEAIDSLLIAMPIPYTAKYHSHNEEYFWNRDSLNNFNNKYPYPTYPRIPDDNNSEFRFDVSSGASGQVMWYVGDYIYQSAEIEQPGVTTTYELLARLTFSVVITDDCYILAGSDECVPQIVVYGESSGKGHISGVNFGQWPFIYGYRNAPCDDEPITTPPQLTIEALDECGDNQTVYEIRSISLCAESPTSVPYADVAQYFINGAKFYNKIDPSTGKPPVDDPTVEEYTINNPFPGPDSYLDPIEDRTAYYAIPNDPYNVCYWTFYLIDLPVPEISLSQSSDTICEGSSTNILDFVTLIPADPESLPEGYPTELTYTYTVYSNAAGTVPVNANVSPTTSRNYWVRAQIDNSMCLTDLVPVWIEVLPRANVPANTQLEVNACSGAQFNIDPKTEIGNSVFPANTVTTYSWEAPDPITNITGLAAGTNETNFNGTLVNNGTTSVDVVYVVTPYSLSEDEDVPCAGISFEVVVTIYPYPAAPNVQNLTVCYGEDIDLQNAVVGGTIPYNFYTSATGGTPLDSPIVTGVTGNQTFWVVDIEDVTVGTPCESERVQFTLTVLPAPVINITTTISTVLCEESQVVLSATTDAEATIYWYESETGGEYIATGSPATITLPIVTQQTTKRYYAEAVFESTTGCVSVARDYIDITINPNAIAAQINVTNGGTICTGNSVVLTASLAAGANITDPVFTWYDSSGNEIGVGPQYNTGSLTTNVTTSITYYVSVRGSNYCENLEEDRAVTVVTVQQMPELSITVDNSSKCYTEGFVLTPTISGTTTATFYGWYLDDPSSPGVGYINDVVGNYSPQREASGITSTSQVVPTTYTRPNANENNVTLQLRVQTGVCGYVIETVDLEILPYPTSYTIEMVEQPTTLQNVCQDTAYIVKMKSTGVGQISNLDIIFSDNADNTLIGVRNAYYTPEYDIDNPELTDWTQLYEYERGEADVNSTTKWRMTENIEDDNFVLNSEDSIYFKIEVYAGCGFFNGGAYEIIVDANDACDNAIASPAPRVTTDVFGTVLDEGGVSFNYDVITTFDPPAAIGRDGDSVVMRLAFYPQGDDYMSNSLTETAYFFIPDGFEILRADGETPLGYTAISNAPAFSEFTIDDYENPQTGAIGVEIYFPIPDGLTEGDSVVFEIMFTTFFAQCITYDFYAQVYYKVDIECDNQDCEINLLVNGDYPEFVVDAYKFSLIYPQDAPVARGNVADNKWYGTFDFLSESDYSSELGDKLYADFYIDSDNNNILDENSDVFVKRIGYPVSDSWTLGSTFQLAVEAADAIAFGQGEQLLVHLHNDTAFCNNDVFPIATFYGPNSVCEGDTVIFYAPAGKSNYTTVRIDGVSGATPTRIPLEGDADINEHPDEYRIVWPVRGNFNLVTTYSVTVDEQTTQLIPVNYPFTVNAAPTIALTGSGNTRICLGASTELSQYINETSAIENITVFSVFSKDVTEGGDITYTPVGSFSRIDGVVDNEILVYPQKTTTYTYTAQVGDDGCESRDSIDFIVYVDEMPEVWSIGAYTYPDCNDDGGSIWIGVFARNEGNNEYEYSINDINGTYLPLELNENGYALIEGLTSGHYTIYVHNKVASACSASQSLSISLVPIHTTLKAEAFVLKDVTSCEVADGEIMIIANGGTPPYEYKLDGNEYAGLPRSGIIGTNFAAGRYNFWIKDNSGCEYPIEEVLIEADLGIELQATVTQASDCDLFGTAQVEVLNFDINNAPYKYRLNSQGWKEFNTPIIGGNAYVGWNTVIVTDKNNCGGSVSFYVPQENPGFGILSATAVNATCENTFGGQIVLDIEFYSNGDNDTLYYTYGNGEYIEIVREEGTPFVTVVIPNLGVGTYEVEVSDESGCYINNMGLTIGLGRGSNINIGTISVVTQPTCDDATGSIYVAVYEGSGNYGYNFDGGNVYYPLPSDGIITEITPGIGLSAGTYIVYVQDLDNLTCTSVESEEITLTPRDSDLFISLFEITDTDDCSVATGTLQVLVQGGTRPYTYILDGVSTPLPANNTFTGLAHGPHTFEVRDAGGCSVFADGFVVNTIGGLDVQLVEIEPSTCANDGLARLVVKNGTPGYSYKIIGYNDFVNFAGDTAYIYVSAGSYGIIVMDSEGCVKYDTFSVSFEGSGLTVSGVSTTDAKCDGTGDGSITFTAEGTKLPLSYRINNGNFNVINNSNPVTIYNLSVGNYTLYVINADSCEYITTNIEIKLNIEPNIQTTSVSVVTQPDCGTSTGSVKITAEGGNGSYQYQINGEGNFLTLDPSGIVPNLAAGTYYFVIREAGNNACPTVRTAYITLESFGDLTISATTTVSTNCIAPYNGRIYLNVGGGTYPYSYTLRGISTADNNVATPLPVPDDGLLGTTFAPGNYVIDVTDANSCTTSILTNVGVQNGISMILRAITAADCEDNPGTFEISVADGLAPYSYILNYTDTIAFIGTQVTVEAPAGYHFVEVIDANGCYVSRYITVNSSNSSYAEVVDTTPAPCDGTAGGSVTFETYGQDLASYTIMNITTNVTEQGNITISDLAQGTYSVTFTFSDGCTYTINNVVIGREPSNDIKIESIYIVEQAGCSGEDPGTIKIVVTGGSDNYYFAISNNLGVADFLPANGEIFGFAPGVYTFYIWDAGNTSCPPVVSSPIELSPRMNTLRIFTTGSTVTACGVAEGAINAQVIGAVGDVVYTINNGEDTYDLPEDGDLGLFASGRYIITIYDESGCMASSEAIVTVETTAIGLVLTQIAEADCDQNGQMRIAIDPPAGNNPVWRYQLDGKEWKPFVVNTVTEEVTSGWHKVIVRNDAGCYAEAEIYISNTAGIILSSVETKDAPCDGTEGGSIHLNITGGTVPYSITNYGNINLTDVPAGDLTIDNLPVGVYSIVVTDAAGCIATYEKIYINHGLDIFIANNDYNITYINIPVNGNIFDNDFDYNNSILTLVSNFDPQNGVIQIDELGNYTYTPNTDYLGNDTIYYTVKNICGNTSEAMLVITVLDEGMEELPPIAVTDLYSTYKDVTIAVMDIRSNDIERNGGTLSLPTIISQPSNGTLIDNSDGTYGYTPNDEFIGTDIFYYSVCSNEYPTLCDTTWVTIIVTGNTEIIYAFTDWYSMNQNQVLYGTTILENDLYPAGYTPVITVISQPSNGGLHINADGTFEYLPDVIFYGTDAFLYELCVEEDAGIVCDTAWVYIYVNKTPCPVVAPPRVQSPQTFCPPATVADLMAFGQNIKWYASEDATEALDPDTALEDNTTYYAGQTIGICESDQRSYVLVTFSDEFLTPPTVPSPQLFCDGATLADLVTDGSNIIWYASATGDDVLASTEPLADGTTYYAAISAGACESTTRTAVTVQETSDFVSYPIDDQSFCESASVSDIRLNVYGNITWYPSETSTLVLAPGTQLTTGTYWAEYQVGDCETTTRISVNITIDEYSAPIIATNQDMCPLSTLANLVVEGAGVKWYDVAENGRELPLDTQIEDGKTYYAVQTNGDCEGEIAAVTVNELIVNPPVVTTPQEFCGSATVADLYARGVNLTWYDSDGNVLASSASLENEGLYYVTQHNGTCESQPSYVKVIITDELILDPPSITTPQRFCSLVGMTVADLWTDGTNILWYSSANGGSPLDPSTPLVADDYYAARVAGNCESTTRTQVFVAQATPSQPPAINAQQFCEGALISNIEVPNDHIVWYFSFGDTEPLSPETPLVNHTYYAKQSDGECESTSGVFVEITISQPPTVIASATQTFCYEPVIADLEVTGHGVKWFESEEATTALGLDFELVNGETYYVAQTNGDCESDRVAVTVTIYLLDPPYTFSPQSFCEGALVANLYAELTNEDDIEAGNTINWYDAAGNLLSPSTLLDEGETYYVSQSNDYCETEKIEVLIEFLPTGMPDDIIANDVTICSGSIPTLAAVGAFINTYRWYNANGDLLHVGSIYEPDDPIFVDETDTIYYYVSVTNPALCENLPENRKEVKLIVLQQPEVEIIPNTAGICYPGTFTLTPVITGLEGTTVESFQWYIKNSLGDFVAPNEVNGIFSPSASGGITDISGLGITYAPILADATNNIITLALEINAGICGMITDTLELSLWPLPVIGEITIISQPETEINICEEFEYELEIEAIGTGGLTNLIIALDDYRSTGIEALGGQYYYEDPINPANNEWRDMILTSSLEYFEFTISEDDFANGEVYALSGGESLRIKITAITGCEFFSGSPVRFLLNASDACGTFEIDEKFVISDILNIDFGINDNIIYSLTSEIVATHVDRNGDGIGDPVVFPPLTNPSGDPIYFVDNDVNKDLIWTATFMATGDNPNLDTDSLYFLIPSGMTLISGISSTTHSTFYSGITPEIAYDDENGIEYTIPLPTGLTMDTEVNISFEFNVDDAECDDYSFYMEIISGKEADCATEHRTCEVYETRAGSYFDVTIQWYEMEFDNTSASSTGVMTGDYWRGQYSVHNISPFYDDDDLFIDFYIDRNNNGIIDTDETTDGPVASQHFLTVAGDADAYFILSPDIDVPAEAGYQLLATHYGSTCYDMVVPISTIFGPETLCEGDTAEYVAPTGMNLYSFTMSTVSGTAPIRMPLEGNAAVNPTDSVAKYRFTTPGEYYTTLYYMMPEDGNPVGIRVMSVRRNIVVNERPVLAYTGSSEISICRGVTISLGDYFSDTKDLDDTQFTYYIVNSDETLTELNSENVTPLTNTIYRAIASALGCESSIALDLTVNIVDPVYITSIYVLEQPTCDSETGSIYISATGGSGIYEFSYDGIDYSDFPVDGIIDGLSAGSYRIYVREFDNESCNPAVSQYINLNPYNSDLTLQTRIQNARTCNQMASSSSDGAITLVIGGGTMPYTYMIVGLDSDFKELPADNRIGNLDPGTYVVIVKDADNCTANTIAVVGANAGMLIGIINTVNATCDAEGEVTIEIVGGRSPYQYQLNYGSHIDILGNSVVIPVGSGSHMVYIYDSEYCFDSIHFSISLDEDYYAEIIDINDALCDGTGSGSFTIKLDDVVRPITYVVGNNEPQNVPPTGDILISNLSSGIYNVVLDFGPTNGEECLLNLNNIEIGIDPTAVIEVRSVYVTSYPTCDEDLGNITVEVIGGSGQYEYNFDGSDTRLPLNADGSISELLPAGTYTVYVWDADLSNCTAAISTNITLNPVNSDLSVTASSTPTTDCSISDGTISILTYGGIGTIRYSINGSEFEPVPAYPGLIGDDFASGTYDITIEDETGCIATTSVNVENLNIELNLRIGIQPALCNQLGAVEVLFTPPAGTGTWRYQINEGALTPFIGNDIITFRLPAGNHTMYLENQYGCNYTEYFTVGLYDSDFIFTAVGSEVDCNEDGTITLDIEGGTAPYLVHIAADETVFEYNIANSGVTVLEDIPVGIYYVSVSDVNGCNYILTNVSVTEKLNYIIAVNDYNITYINKPVKANVLDNDIDFLLNKGVLTVIDNTTPKNGNIIINSNGFYTYTPNTNFVGYDTVMYTVQHECGYINYAYLYLTVIYEYIAPRPPVAGHDLYTTHVNIPILNMSVMDNDIDIDGGIIEISDILVQPNHGLLSDNGDGTFGYEPNTNFVGRDYFLYKICNENNLCDSAWVTIIVSPLETEPDKIITFPDFYSTTQDNELAIVLNNNILINDIYPTGATLINIITQPVNGVLSSVNHNGTFVYTPNAGFYGNDIFQYELCMYDGGDIPCDTTWVNIIVLANDCPNIMPPVVTTSQEFCDPATVGDLVASGLNIKWYDVETDGEPLELTETLTDGSIYYASQTDGNGCESARRSPVKVSIVETIVLNAPEIDSPQEFCENATIADIITNNPNIVWYTTSTGDVIIPTDTELIDDETYYAGIIAGSCESTSRTPVVINIVSEITILPEIDDQAFCLGAMLSDIVVGNGVNVDWYLTEDNGSPLTPDTKLSQRIYWAEVHAGDCQNTSRVPVNITLLEFEAPVAQAIQSFCYGETLADLKITGAGIKWYDAETNGNELPLTTLLESGKTYYAVQSNGACEGEMLAITTNEIIVIPPIVTSPQFFCEPAYVSDLDPNDQDIIWYAVETGGLPLDSTEELVSGNTYWAARTNGTCESVYRSHVIAYVEDFVELPAPNIQSPQQMCNIGNPTLADVITDGSNIVWYATADDVTSLPVNTVLVNGSTYYAAFVAGSCESAERTPVTINIVPIITYAPEIEDQSFCEGATIADINVPNVNIIWYRNENSNNSIGPSTILESRTYWASQIVGWCESTVRIPVVITIDVPSAPIADDEQFFCQDVNPTIENIVITGSGIKWYDAPVNGDEISLDTPLTHGATYFAAQTNGDCIGETVAVTVWLYYNVNPPVASTPQEFCIETPITLTLAAVKVQGQNIRWYDAEVDGNELLLTTVLTDGMIYWASQSLGHCESSGRTAVKVILNEEMEVSAPVITSPQQFCSGGTIADLLINGYDNINWYITETHTIPLDSHIPLVNGETYFAGVVNGDCESTERTPVTVTLVPEITILPQIDDQSFCDGAILASVIVPNNSIVWYLSPVGGEPLSLLTVLETRTYYAAQSVGDCENTNRVPVNISIDEPSTPITVGEQMFCVGATIADLEVTGHGIHWYETIDSDAPLALTYPLVHNTTYYAANSTGVDCVGERAAVKVLIYDNLLPPVVQTPVELCEIVGNLTLANISVQGLNIQWYASETDEDPLPVNTQLVDGTIYWVSQSIGECKSERSYVKVIINNEMIIPAPEIDSPMELCQNLAGTIRLSDLPVNGQTILWYANPEGTFLLPSGTILANNIIVYAGQRIGECQSTELTQVSITFVPEITVLPDVPSPQYFCEGAMIGSIITNTTGIVWYETIDATEPLVVNHILETGTYYAAVIIGADCESTNRLPVEIEIEPDTYNYIEETQSFCVSAEISDITVIGYGLIWYSDEELTTELALDEELIHGSTYYAANTNGDCALIAYAVTVYVYDDLPPPTVMSPIELCSTGGELTLADVYVQGSNIRWYDAQVGGDELPLTTVLTDGSIYWASQSIGLCESER
ncbi:MAG: tandem-95 repeat protein [Bacteroidales bacterium]|jgi:hypothetical protein|nr:tandem-95 repeat protein [Bacteroidales bacterium]